jgi:hypothetical protein
MLPSCCIMCAGLHVLLSALCCWPHSAPHSNSMQACAGPSSFMEVRLLILRYTTHGCNVGCRGGGRCPALHIATDTALSHMMPTALSHMPHRTRICGAPYAESLQHHSRPPHPRPPRPQRTTPMHNAPDGAGATAERGRRGRGGSHALPLRGLECFIVRAQAVVSSGMYTAAQWYSGTSALVVYY